MAATNKAKRIPALDYVKGALVLIMVLYHWINYFQGPHDNRYLRFLTPSFICITGFLISHVYFSRYGIKDPGLPKRLAERGLKLFGVFVLLNLARGLFSPPPPAAFDSPAQSALRRIVDVYVIGTGLGGGQYKAVAFFILVPISYLLILSALLVFVSRFYRHTFHVACALSLLCIVAMDVRGIESGNLELLAIGLMGVIVGYLPLEKLNTLIRRPYLLGAAYLLYLGAITLWNVIYPLQIVGVCLSLLILYLLGQSSSESARISGRIVLLGKYSLFGYIAQIAILQMLRRGLLHVNLGPATLAASFVAAFALTIVSVEVVHSARAGSATVDRMYKAVFA